MAMIRKLTLFFIAASIATYAAAWIAPKEQQKITFPSSKDMKKFAEAAAAASFLGVSSLLTSPVNAASPDFFTGSYADPKQPSCGICMQLFKAC